MEHSEFVSVQGLITLVGMASAPKRAEPTSKTLERVTHVKTKTFQLVTYSTCCSEPDYTVVMGANAIHQKCAPRLTSHGWSVLVRLTRIPSEMEHVFSERESFLKHA